jgi:hypothetical protein
MFYLNENLVRETPGVPDATFDETSKEIDAGWRARFHAGGGFGARMAPGSLKKAMTLCQIKGTSNSLPLRAATLLVWKMQVYRPGRATIAGSRQRSRWPARVAEPSIAHLFCLIPRP